MVIKWSSYISRGLQPSCSLVNIDAILINPTNNMANFGSVEGEKRSIQHWNPT